MIDCHNLVYKDPKKHEDGYLVKVVDESKGKIVFNCLKSKLIKSKAISDNARILYLRVPKSDAISLSSTEEMLTEHARNATKDVLSVLKIKDNALDDGYISCVSFSKEFGWVLKLRTYGKQHNIIEGETVLLSMRLIGLKVARSSSMLCWELQQSQAIEETLQFVEEDGSDDETELLPDPEDIKEMANEILEKVKILKHPYEEALQELNNIEQNVLQSISNPFSISILQVMEAASSKLEKMSI